MVGSLYRDVEVIKGELAYKWFKVVPGQRYKIVYAQPDGANA